MNTDTSIKKTSTQVLNDLIIDCIQDVKGKNITLLDLRQLDDAPTDYFIICEGESTVQVKAIANHIRSRIKQETQTLPNHIEGIDNSKWVLVDYFTTLVHVFYPETREFYQLEQLWSDAKVTEYEDIV